MNSQPSARSGSSNAVWMVTSAAPPRGHHSTRARTRALLCARATGARGAPARRRRAGRRDERLQVRPRDLPEVQAGENDVAELQEAEAEPVPARVLDVLDEAARDERREQARDAAGVDPRPPCDLVRAELGVGLGE